LTAFDVTLLIFFLIILSAISKRFPFSAPIATFFGIVWGCLGGQISIFSMECIAKVSLIFFLFIDGARLHFTKALHYHSIRLPLVGFAISLVLSALFLQLFWGFSLQNALIITLPLLTIDAKTTPHAFSAMLPIRVQQMVNVEGAFSGQIAFFIFSLLILSHPLAFFRELLLAALIGSALSYFATFLLKASMKFKWGKPPLVRGSLVLLPFLVFGLCTFLKVNGLIGALFSGIIIGHFARAQCGAIFDLSRRAGTYLYQLLLIIFGVFAVHVISKVYLIPALIFALSFLSLTRFIATTLSFIHSPYQWKTIGYFTFMNPKGVITVAMIVVFMNHFQHFGLQITVLVALITLYIQPLFSPIAAKVYGKYLKENRDLYENFPTVALPY
jgi:NhaP-type Na+/H+ or K+/H+ antiporter